MLVAENISKHFGSVKALSNVNMGLLPGKVTAIIGENGAGKSTLMKILSGVYTEYDGRIVYNGKHVTFTGTSDAQKQGISIIHQELNLVPYLSITENIFLGREITNFGFLDRKAMRDKTKVLLNKLRLKLNPDTLVADLKVGQQQVVEIAKALLYRSEVIIMDEPTSAISESEADVLFGIIADLKKENKTIVYISHKLNELFKIADSYIVLRDGCTVQAGEIAGVTNDQLISKMIGRDMEIRTKKGRDEGGEVLLSLRDICLKRANGQNGHILNNISFHLHSGEILGIFGLMGAGRTELMETIQGIHQQSTGDVALKQESLNIKSPRHAIRSGIALVPEDRKKDGLVLGLDIKTNISLSSMQNVTGSGFISASKEVELANKYITALKIKATSEKQMVKNLSGGNQQKVVLARCLATGPKVLMLDEPTRGIDINAKNEIYKLISELAAAGMGIIMVSSELPEILAISDRILVMTEGNVTATFNAADATEDKLLKAAIPNTI